VKEKAAHFISANAEASAKEKAESQSKKSGDAVLQKHRWVLVKLVDRKALSEDARRYTFGLPDGMEELGLGTCQHIQLGIHLEDKMHIRSRTLTKPLLPDRKGTEDRAGQWRGCSEGYPMVRASGNRSLRRGPASS